jgi:hypothetical protein
MRFLKIFQNLFLQILSEDKQAVCQPLMIQIIVHRFDYEWHEGATAPYIMDRSYAGKFLGP